MSKNFFNAYDRQIQSYILEFVYPGLDFLLLFDQAKSKNIIVKENHLHFANHLPKPLCRIKEIAKFGREEN
jgi:hypothetical protein